MTDIHCALGDFNREDVLLAKIIPNLRAPAVGNDGQSWSHEAKRRLVGSRNPYGEGFPWLISVYAGEYDPDADLKEGVLNLNDSPFYDSAADDEAAGTDRCRKALEIAVPKLVSPIEQLFKLFLGREAHPIVLRPPVWEEECMPWDGLDAFQVQAV